ncbi:hypothetical protein OQJ15_03330 [Fluoribacter dumoffii]|uniref:hypothetical protein n=1 Tax=Fluoribacter dumoffii TaxID=463 RepID=UPI0022445B1F|nr:hypothetical protein [Fluoribacter dumoffii]MCW8385335.1 hypothetical protein [Fluoribacter dumoffii]MCW8496368.1 hypothetical protein [Fluoribacter dumoffii]
MRNDTKTELEKIICFMYINADFFAAPFLNNKMFSSWARTYPGMKEFSNQLHEALGTSNPVAINEVDWLKAFRIAIVGSSILKTGEFSKMNCLLTGNSEPLFNILKSNPNLASVIKNHMNCDFFENWYATQSSSIKHKREKLLTKLEWLIKSIDFEFENYQTKKLKALISMGLPRGVTLGYEYEGFAVSNNKDGTPKPSKIIIENKGSHDVSELQLLVDKFNFAQSARDSLNNPSLNAFSRLNQFSQKVNDKTFVDTFTADNDSEGKRLLKIIGYALTTIFLGLGFYLSYKNKGTWKFWKSAEHELLESAKEKTEAFTPLMIQKSD